MTTDSELLELLLENRKMRAALQHIELWLLPNVTLESGVSCSYESVHGSKGAISTMRKVAREALNDHSV